MAIKIKTDTAPDERKKSTAARKADVQVTEVRERSGKPDESDKAAIAAPTKLSEGSSAPPVDTPSRTFRTRAPNNTFDRKAYMAEYMRQYNAKKKGKKIPYAGSE